MLKIKEFESSRAARVIEYFLYKSKKVVNVTKFKCL